MTSPLAAAVTGSLADHPTELLVLLGVAALVPIALVTLTCFLKIVVVLSLTRSALGAPQIPPSSAITGLGLLLTFVVMAPVAEEAWSAARTVPSSRPDHVVDMAAAASAPLRGFLERFARRDDRQMFLDLARRAHPPAARATVAERDFTVLAPAFVISELRRAFTIGFLVFLPFLVVDLLVGNVLLALGLAQVSPTMVALPFKLLLFVAVDGWKLVSRGLVAGYLG